jgi:hypothetical protein
MADADIQLSIELDAYRRALAPNNTTQTVVRGCGVEPNSEIVRYLIRECRDQLHAAVRDVTHRTLLLGNAFSRNPYFGVTAAADMPDERGHSVQDL